MIARRAGVPLLAGLLGLAHAAPAAAHRLDEYLLASRIGLEPGRVMIELDVTPGMAMAPEAWRRLDRDGDGRVSPDEADAAAREVLSAIAASLDGRPLALTLVAAGAPDRGDLDAGTGVIRVEAAAPTGRLAPGRHLLAYANEHRPGPSVYLANALVPADPRVGIVSQQRDDGQQHLTIAFDVAPSRRTRGGAAVGSLTALFVVLAARRRRRRVVRETRPPHRR